jgi:cytochrome c peroxidase
MHDGRFGTLESVLNHYSSGIVDLATLDPILNKMETGIALSENRKTQLIAFLKH